jgi:hypothetical protein
LGKTSEDNTRGLEGCQYYPRLLAKTNPKSKSLTTDFTDERGFHGFTLRFALATFIRAIPQIRGISDRAFGFAFAFAFWLAAWRPVAGNKIAISL